MVYLGGGVFCPLGGLLGAPEVSAGGQASWDVDEAQGAVGLSGKSGAPMT